MTEEIRTLKPCRWEVFQCLLIDGGNAGAEAIRNAETFVISNAEFDTFLDRHRSLDCLVPESNEKMRFLDCTGGAKAPSKSVLDVGVENALEFSSFDENMFLKRGGKYTWSKADMKLDWYTRVRLSDRPEA